MRILGVIRKFLILIQFQNNFFSFHKHHKTFVVAPSCGFIPKISNGNSLGRAKSYYGKTVTYRCDPEYSFTDGSTIKSITCYTNENGTLFWRGLNANLICERSLCSPSPEFYITGVTNLNPYLPAYVLESTVEYTCPNGLSRKATCRYDQMQSKAIWIYEGRCVRTI